MSEITRKESERRDLKDMSKKTEVKNVFGTRDVEDED